MTNDAVVTKLLPDNKAEVKVIRLTACGGNCGGCESCICDNEVRAVADNPVGAKPGQRVVIESKSSKVFGAVVMVYTVPMLLFLLGYITAMALGCTEGVCILASFLALVFSAVMLVWAEKRKKKSKISFSIIKKFEAKQ